MGIFSVIIGIACVVLVIKFGLAIVKKLFWGIVLLALGYAIYKMMQTGVNVPM